MSTANSTSAPQDDTHRGVFAHELGRVSSTISSQLADIIANARWFTALVVAELAGIVKFTETSHGWQFLVMSIALIALAISAAAFIISIFSGQFLKNKLESNFTEMGVALAKDEISTEMRDKFLAELPKLLHATDNDSIAVFCSYVGLFAFLVGTILAGIALFVP